MLGEIETHWCLSESKTRAAQESFNFARFLSLRSNHFSVDLMFFGLLGKCRRTSVLPALHNHPTSVMGARPTMHRTVEG